MNRLLTAPLFALPALALLSGCASEADTSPTAAEPTQMTLELTEIATELEFPWGMAALPGGDLLVTEREGRLRILRDDVLHGTPISGLPDDIYVDRQGGLFDVALHPDFAANRMVYISYAQGTSDSNQTTVIRGTLNDGATALEGVEEIFVAEMPEKQGGAHFGGRIGFDNTGALILTTGDGFRWMDETQDVDNHFGKVLRMTDTGEPLADNPFYDQGGPARYVVSYGHRNVQGMAYDESRDILYTHEHGPKGGDELNIIAPGTNYGWPVITYGVNYDGTIITDETEREGMAQPDMKWVPSIAPSDMVLYEGDAYPGWQGDLLIGAMQGPAGRKLVRVDLDENGQVVGREDLLTEAEEGYRTLEVGAGGKLYLGTIDVDGKIYRLDVAGS